LCQRPHSLGVDRKIVLTSESELISWGLCPTGSRGTGRLDLLVSLQSQGRGLQAGNFTDPAFPNSTLLSNIIQGCVLGFLQWKIIMKQLLPSEAKPDAFCSPGRDKTAFRFLRTLQAAAPFQRVGRLQKQDLKDCGK
jgi:hypothetical protein